MYVLGTRRCQYGTGTVVSTTLYVMTHIGIQRYHSPRAELSPAIHHHRYRCRLFTRNRSRHTYRYRYHRIRTPKDRCRGTNRGCDRSAAYSVQRTAYSTGGFTNDDVLTESKFCHPLEYVTGTGTSKM